MNPPTDTLYARKPEFPDCSNPSKLKLALCGDWKAGSTRTASRERQHLARRAMLSKVYPRKISAEAVTMRCVQQSTDQRYTIPAARLVLSPSRNS
jgi:hypothetical protein